MYCLFLCRVWYKNDGKGVFGNKQPIGTGDNALSVATGDMAGTVYVFAESDSGWTEVAILHAEDSFAGDLFGGSISMTGDQALIGAIKMSGLKPNGTTHGGGAAYLFERASSGWLLPSGPSRRSRGPLEAGWAFVRSTSGRPARAPPSRSPQHERTGEPGPRSALAATRSRDRS